MLIQYLQAGAPSKVANNKNPIQRSTWKLSKTATNGKHCCTSHQESFMLLLLRCAKYINPCSLGQSPKSSDNVSPGVRWDLNEGNSIYNVHCEVHSSLHPTAQWWDCLACSRPFFISDNSHFDIQKGVRGRSVFSYDVSMHASGRGIL